MLVNIAGPRLFLEPSAGNLHKNTPGVYPTLNSGLRKESQTTYWDAVESWINDRRRAVEPLNAGVRIIIPHGTWGEPTGDFAAAKSIMQRLLDACDAADLQLIVCGWIKAYNDETYSDFPSTPQSNVGPALSDFFYDNSLAEMHDYGGGVLQPMPTIWTSAGMQPFIDLYAALGDEFDDHPRLEMFCSFETGQLIATASHHEANLITQIKRLCTDVKPHFPTTHFCLYYNYLPTLFPMSQTNVDKYADILDHMVSTQVGLSAPDIKYLDDVGVGGPNPTDLLFMGAGSQTIDGVTANYGTGYQGQLPCMVCQEYLSSHDRVDILDRSRDIGNTHLAWMVLESGEEGPDENWTAVYDFLDAETDPLVETACPNVYDGCQV